MRTSAGNIVIPQQDDINGVGVLYGIPILDSGGDGDGVPDSTDNCPNDANPDQIDSDSNGIGDACQVKVLPWLILLLSND